MMIYVKGQGSAGMVIDGCLRDRPNIGKRGVPLWIRGVIPQLAHPDRPMPFAVNGPIAFGGVTVIPGDIVVAADDGAVVVPAGLAEACIARREDHEREDFSRETLPQGGDLRRYYPLSGAARPEYEAWKAKRAGHDPSR
jgi:regulator of RNase E activity RraA